MKEVFLVVDCVILFLQTLSLISNGVVVYKFFRCVNLNSSPNLRLMFYVCITDCLLALSVLPYMMYLTLFWNPVSLNYHPMFIIMSALPVPIQLKVHLSIMISNATSRILVNIKKCCCSNAFAMNAISLPTMFRRINHKHYASGSVLIGLLLASVDISMISVLSPIHPKPGCAAFGCFLNKRFRYYWGTSNMVMGTVMIILTTIFIVELNTIAKNTKRSKLELKKFRKANKMSLLMLCSSLICITIPSVGVGLVDFLGYSIFLKVGPFYLIGLLLAGCVNSILYLALSNHTIKLAENVVEQKPQIIVNAGLSTVATVSAVIEAGNRQRRRSRATYNLRIRRI